MEIQNSANMIANANEEPNLAEGEIYYNPAIIYEDGESYDDPSGILPGTDDYPGPLNFQLFLNTEDKAKRAWLYSTVLKKLYIDINKVVCVQFKLKQPPGKNGSKENLRVRALPVYALPEYLQDPVHRCPVHVMADRNTGNSHVPWLFHVLRAEHHEAVYHINRKSMRHSVVVPLHNPTLGSEFVTIMFKFTCKTSCAFGLNRKPVHVVFTLENTQGEVLGRRKLLVKVCSCPKRDLHRDEIVSRSADVDPIARKRRCKEVDNSLAYSSMEIYSPNTTKEIKLEQLDEDEVVVDDDSTVYTVPPIAITGRHLYQTTLEMLHGHFLGVAVRNDALIDLHPTISQISELLDKVKNEQHSS